MFKIFSIWTFQRGKVCTQTRLETWDGPLTRKTETIRGHFQICWGFSRRLEERGKTTNVNGEQEKGAWAKRMRHRQGVLSPSYLEFGPNFLWLITKEEVKCCSCEPFGEGEVVVRMSQLKLLFLCCLFILQLCEWSSPTPPQILHHKIIRQK